MKLQNKLNKEVQKTTGRQENEQRNPEVCLQWFPQQVTASLEFGPLSIAKKHT